jgi:predicted transposase YbfD/YdcC
MKGCVVTIDAIGCQKAIVKQIVEQGGDYLLALKGNQSKLAEEVEAIFDGADEAHYEGYAVDFHEAEERNHGRQEIRRYGSIACEGLLVNAEP